MNGAFSMVHWKVWNARWRSTGGLPLLFATLILTLEPDGLVSVVTSYMA